MTNWRSEPFTWVPCEGTSSDAHANLSFDARALVTYLAKFVDDNGAAEIVGPETFNGLTRLFAVNINERAAFRKIVDEALTAKKITASENRVTIPSYRSWQASRELRYRLFLREPAKFAEMPAFPRMYAAELTRIADNDGEVGASIESMAERLAAFKGESLRADRRRIYKTIVASRIMTLVANGFLIVDGTVRIRDFAESQRTPTTVPDDGWETVRMKVAPLVFERDGNLCTYCGSPYDLTIDHIVPRLQGGAHDPSNLTTACRPCNSAKNDRTPEEWVNRPARCVAYAASKAITMEPAAC